MKVTNSAEEIRPGGARGIAMSRSTGSDLDLAETAYQTGGRQALHGYTEPPGARERPRSPRNRGGNIDPSLLEKVTQIIESIEIDDTFSTPLYLSTLAGSLLEMWETATGSSEAHQDILATVEAGARVVARTGSVTPGQLSAFREAVSDLARHNLVPENAEFVRERFVREGFGPLSFVGEDDGECLESGK